MNIFKIIIHIAFIYLFYALGMWIQNIFDLFIPGSVIGLLLLFFCLLFNIIRLEWVEVGAQFMMKHLVIFFIPSTVSLIGYFTLFVGKGIFLVVVTMISTIIVMLVSGVISDLIVRRRTHD